MEMGELPLMYPIDFKGRSLERLQELRKRIPNISFQMLIRGQMV